MTNHGVYVNSATGAAATTADMVDGALMIGKTGGVPVAANLTPGSGISITNAANSITIASTGGGGGSVPAGAQLVFLVRLTSTVDNVTGDNTVYTIIFDTADVNVGTCYNTSTGVFTVPTTGIYMFQSCITLYQISSSNTALATQIHNTTTNTYAQFYEERTWSIGSWLTITSTAFLEGGTLTAGDTVVCNAIAYGSTKTSGIYTQATVNYTWWACYRITPAGANAFPWTDVTSASVGMNANNGYTADYSTLCTLTLPTSAAYGSIIEVVGLGAGGWKIAQNASQMIHINAATSTTGTGGYLSSNDRYNSVKLLCTVADLEFTVISSEGTLNLN